MRPIVRIAQNPAGQRTAVLAVLQQNLSIDNRHVDALRRLADAHGTGREVVHDLVRQRAYRVGIEDHDVRHHARLQQATVVQPEDRCRLEGQPPHRRFQRHDLLLAHPFAQQPRAEAEAALELHVRAAIRQTDDRVRVVQDLRDRLVIDVVLAVQERGLQILLDDEIEERVDDALALCLGDLADRHAHETLVLRQHRRAGPSCSPTTCG